MVAFGKSAILEFELGGISSDAPIEWEDIELIATFDSEDIEESVQPSISIDAFTFTLTEYEKILKHLNDGLNGGVGIFEGFPFKIRAKNNRTSTVVFDGFLDLSDNVVIDVNKNRVECRAKLGDGLNGFNERLEPITFGYLESLGEITVNDYVDVLSVIEDIVTILEILLSAMMIFILFRELRDNIRATAKAIADAVAHLSGGISGTVAAAVFAVVVAIIQIAYTTLLAIALVDLGVKFVTGILPPSRTSKAMTLRRMMEVVCKHLGYGFISPLTELDRYHDLPTVGRQDDTDNKTGLLTKVRGVEIGIPRPSDYGYFAKDLFADVKKAFFGKFAIIGNDVQFRTDSDPFWQKTSTYVMPDIKLPPKRFNTGDFKSNRLVSFLTDPLDTWTTHNFQGTNFEVKTDAIITVNPTAKYLKKGEEIKINFALGNRKDELSALENVVKNVAEFIDDVTGILGKGSNLASGITNKVGHLKISDNNYTRPKWIYLDENGKIPANHRDLLSAKYLDENYISFRSFVEHNFRGQKTLYNSIENVPFGYEDFLKLTNNSFLTTFDNGKQGKARKVAANLAAAKAKMDISIQEAYTFNLQATKIEPK